MDSISNGGTGEGENRREGVKRVEVLLAREKREANCHFLAGKCVRTTMCQMVNTNTKMEIEQQTELRFAAANRFSKSLKDSKR